MPRKLKLDGLRADLTAVEGLLAEAAQNDDPVGKIQYEYRRQQIADEILSLKGTVEHKASIALFFGGDPVFGSRGIVAEFAGDALGKFQEIVSKRFASAELGAMAQRGPVPLSKNTNLMITEIARGSFGFVLDELDDQRDVCDTALKQIVDDVANLVMRTASQDDDEFEQAVENLDKRTLSALKDFFVTLDSSNATVRLVEDSRDISLDRLAVNRGRLRTEATEIEEGGDDITGELLGIIPVHRRFELQLANGDVISGTASKEATEKYLASLHSPQGAPGKLWKTKMQIRTIKKRNQPDKFAYKLLELTEQVSK